MNSFSGQQDNITQSNLYMIGDLDGRGKEKYTELMPKQNSTFDENSVKLLDKYNL